VRGSGLTHQRFDLPHVEPACDDVTRECFCIRMTDERSRMAGRQFALAIAAWTGSGSLSSRSMLATWLRLLPTTFAISSWPYLNSSPSD